MRRFKALCNWHPLTVSGLVVLLSLVLFAPAMGQTVVHVFGDNGIHFGNPDLFANDSIQVTDSGRRIHHTLTLPEIEGPVQITAEVTIRPDDNGTPCSADPWDRAGSIYLQSPDFAEIELLKFITGYGGHTNHTQDVTFLAPLLQGEVTITGFIDTWVSPAWKVDFSLTYEAGSGLNTTWAVGAFNHQSLRRAHVTDIDPSVTIDVPAGMLQYYLAYFTTGHGAVDEFVHRDNVIYIDGVEVYREQPWRNDCYTLEEFNPCGNYPPPRAGWCPGDMVLPDVIDVSGYLTPGEHEIHYAVENIDPTDGYWRVSAYLAAWQLGPQPVPTQVGLKPPTELILAADNPFKVEVQLQNEEGHWVYDAQTTVELAADDDAVQFSTDGESWANPLNVEMDTGQQFVWVNISTEGMYDISATDADNNPLDPAEPLTVQVLTNHALLADTDASCQCTDTEGAEMAVDGLTNTKWCCNDPAPHWWTVTLPDSADLNYFVIRHAGIRENPEWNTTDFQVQMKDEQGNWQSLVTVTDNPANSNGSVTVHELSQVVRTNEIRLFITNPGGDDVSRIYEFEAYLNNELLAIEDDPTPVASAFALSQNYPNPFNGSTTIQFQLPRAGTVQATIYNTAGEVVQRLVDGTLAEGTHVLRWNGQNADAREASSGVYFLRVRYDGDTGHSLTRSRKLVYLK